MCQFGSQSFQICNQLWRLGLDSKDDLTLIFLDDLDFTWTCTSRDDDSTWTSL